MAADYKAIYDRMEIDHIYTATQLGVAAASLNAMSKRGMVEVLEGKPKKYRKVFSPLAKILELVENRESEFFFLHKKNNPIGMLCSNRGGKIFDCWGSEFDVSDIHTVEVDGKVTIVGREEKVVKCGQCMHTSHCVGWKERGGDENCKCFKEVVVR